MSTKAHPEGSLAARDVTVSAGGTRIVRNVSLDLQSGALTGLIGPNGAGKSTLLRAMLGLAPLTSGAVTLEGRPLASVPLGERARKLSYLAQEGRIEWPLSARAVVALGRRPHRSAFAGPSDADRAAVERALEAVDAATFADRPATTLSAGERARVLLARALSVEAPILLVDEPTAALDPYHQLQVMELLRAEAARGRAVLVVLHDLALAARFLDRVVLMNAGEAVADGPPAQVLTDEALGAVYRIEAVRGGEGEARWLLPWSRR